MNKFKKICLLAALVLLTALGLSACGGDNQSQPLAAQTIKISTADELCGISEYLGEKYSNYVFELQNDIDLSGYGVWQPIGSSLDKSFRGKLDGNGKTIYGLTFGELYVMDEENPYDIEYAAPNAPDFKYAGLFGYLYNATVENLTLSDFDISFFGKSEYIHVGSLAGYAYGKTLIKDVKANNIEIALGTYCYGKIKENDDGSATITELSEQKQYIGGLVGYASGSPAFEGIDIDGVNVRNLVYSVLPVYERDESYNKTKNQIGVEIYDHTSYGSPVPNINNYYPSDAFIGGLSGFVRGNSVKADNVTVTNFNENSYALSLITGSVFGVAYNSELTEITSNSAYVYVTVATKGVVGGIVGLIDGSRLKNSTCDAASIKLVYRGNELDAFTVGGIAGYVNDFSIVEGAAVSDAKIYSQPNKVGTGDRNYPVIGGVAGTIRDSAIKNCVTGGEVLTISGNPIDENYTHNSGMVAIVYGNSSISDCYSEFKAFCGTVVLSEQTLYVDGDGNRVLRFCKENYPKVYYGIAVSLDSRGSLVVDFLGEDSKVIGTYIYASYLGNLNYLESLIDNYYDRAGKRFVDADGNTISLNGRLLTDFVELTGKYTFDNLTYKDGSATRAYEGDTVSGGTVIFGGDGNLLSKS